MLDGERCVLFVCVVVRSCIPVMGVAATAAVVGQSVIERTFSEDIPHIGPADGAGSPSRCPTHFDRSRRRRNRQSQHVLHTQNTVCKAAYPVEQTRGLCRCSNLPCRCSCWARIGLLFCRSCYTARAALRDRSGAGVYSLLDPHVGSCRVSLPSSGQRVLTVVVLSHPGMPHFTRSCD